MRFLTDPNGETMWAVMPRDAININYATGIYPMEDYANTMAQGLRGHVDVVPVKVTVKVIEDDEEDIEDIESIPTVPPGTGTLVF